ncbi:MAG: 5'-methylthioadenosine/S-adenosylhomocysteine nucleosidase [Ardenticatenaceae bacterium]
MTTISLPSALLTALREGRLLIIWGDVPWEPDSLRGASRAEIRGAWKEGVSCLAPVGLPLHALPPLTMLSLDPTKRLAEAFERANVPLQAILRRGERLAAGQHQLLMLGGELASEEGLLLRWRDAQDLGQDGNKTYLLAQAKPVCEGGAILIVVPNKGATFARIWHNGLGSHFEGVPRYGVGKGTLPAKTTKLKSTPSEVLQALQEAVAQKKAPPTPFPDKIQPKFGIITALPKEEAAVKKMLVHSYPEKAYTLGLIPARDGGYHHLALSQAGMGTNIAAVDAAFMLCDYPTIQELIMVGIAGGVPHPNKPDDHVRLGDIVVVNQKGVIQYDLDKESREGTEHRHHPFPPSSRLLRVVKQLAADELNGQRPWLAHIERAKTLFNGARPAPNKDQLAHTDHPTQLITHPHDPKRIPGQPRVFIAPIASGNKLLKNPHKRDTLRKKFSVKAIEMEAAGVAHAAWRRNKGYLVIRGICDYCDQNKNDHWQEYAAVVAAAYMRALLEGTDTINNDNG